MRTFEKNWYFFVLRRSITGPQVKGSRHNSYRSWIQKEKKLQCYDIKVNKVESLISENLKTEITKHKYTKPENWTHAVRRLYLALSPFRDCQELSSNNWDITRWVQLTKYIITHNDIRHSLELTYSEILVLESFAQWIHWHQISRANVLCLELDDKYCPQATAYMID